MITVSDAIWLKTDRKRSRYEKRFTSRFKAVLSKQFTDVANRIDGHNYNSEAILNEVEVSDIMPVFIDLYRSVGVDFARDTYGTHKAQSEENIENNWNAYMTDYAKNKAGKRIVSINEETKRQILKYIQAAIDEGVNEGLGTNEIASKIKRSLIEQGVEINTWRSRMIARTEVVNASNAGAIEGARSLQQPMSKIWIATRDARTREDHLNADNQSVALDDMFDIGGERMDHPGDPSGSAENVINCRCAVAFKVKKLY